MKSMVPTNAGDSYTQPPTGHEVLHWRGSASTRRLDYAGSVDHDVNVNALGLRGRQKTGVEKDSMLLGGVDIVAQQVPLPSHHPRAVKSSHSLLPSTFQRPASNQSNLTGYGLNIALGMQTANRSVKDEASTRHPPLHGILAAAAASLGWALLMWMKCKGFINELSPKSPLAGFMRSHLERPTSVSLQAGLSGRKTAARFCPTRFNPSLPQARGTSA